MERVLIVDDEPGIRHVMSRWITSVGCQVTEAASADEALTAAAGEPFAVTLCDIRLPGRDGVWLAGEIRRAHPDTAVIMSTGVQTFETAVATLQSGVLDYIVKPFDCERLSKALQKGLEWHRSRVADAKLRAELRSRVEQVSLALAEFEMNSTAAVDAMRTMLTIRDRAAYDHGTRVARLAVDLAMVLGVREPALSEIERAALLHDIGKFAVPEAVLQKERALSAAEQQIVRSHPERGYDMLQHVPFLSGAAPLVLMSHERFDGAGYPAGLRGDEIPLGARIIAVADAYDAMTRTRPHRQPVSHRAALEELQQQRGRQFDPAVVDAFQMLHVVH